MIKRGLIFAGFVTVFALQQANAANLWEVYQQAQKSDPTYQAAVATQMSEAELVPSSMAALLPQVNFTGDASLAKARTYNNTPTASGKYTTNSRAYEYKLKLTQTVFNITNWKELAAAENSVKAAGATLNAAAQSLMQRTASAYFAVLQAQEILRYTGANKRALYQQYIQAQQSYKVGVKTITDVYQARSDYETAVSAYISAKNDVANKFEDLRAVTGVLYHKLTPLKDNLPLVNPQPANIDEWVDIAIKQNWSLIAARYTALAAHDTIQAKHGGHFPTADLFAQYDKSFTNSFSRGLTYGMGPTAGVEFSLPIFSGGSVNSDVRKAIADYENASQQQEKTHRDVINNTRQSYLGVLTGISTIRANKRAVIFNRSSLHGTQEEYKVGTQTMVDVLIALEKLYAAQQTYVNSRYDYINSLISLKIAAGTISADDLVRINSWLQYSRKVVKRKPAVKRKSVVKRKPVAKRKSMVKRKPVVKRKSVAKRKSVVTKKLATTAKTRRKLSRDYEYIQVGAYRTRAHANQIANLVRSKTGLPFEISAIKQKGLTLYRVRIGPISKTKVAHVVEQLHTI
jgi:outer membrane protein